MRAKPLRSDHAETAPCQWPYGKQKITGFANRIGVHPGIVVGQLQFRKEIPWSSYRQMLEKVRSIVIQSTLTDGWGQTLPTFMNKER
jgi:hypothetical protein